MRAKTVAESLMTPFSNREGNWAISGTYPLSRMQYEDVEEESDEDESINEDDENLNEDEEDIEDEKI